MLHHNCRLFRFRFSFVALSYLGNGDKSPIPDPFHTGFQNGNDSMNLSNQDASLFNPRHTRHISHRSLLFENDRPPVDGMYGIVDDNGLRDNLSVGHSEVSYGNAFDGPFNRHPLSGYGYDRNSSFLSSSNHSLLGSQGEFSHRRIGSSSNTQLSHQHDPSYLLSEPPLFPENESYLYSSIPSGNFKNQPMMPDRPTHYRMYSSPSFCSPTMMMGSGYSNANQRSGPFPHPNTGYAFGTVLSSILL